MNRTTSVLGALCLSTALLAASDNIQQAPADPDLPQPLDAGFVSSMVGQSPFTRSVNLEQTLQLTGVAYVNGHPVATVLNKLTQERLLITEQPNEQGWRLLAVDAGADPANTQVRVMIGPEALTMHYHGLQPADDGRQRPGGRDSKKDGEKMKPSDLLGTNGRELYASLSRDARDKFKDAIKSKMEKNPELTREQTSDYAQKLFSKLKAGDQGDASSSKPPRTTKPPKKKQGA